MENAMTYHFVVVVAIALALLTPSEGARQSYIVYTDISMKPDQYSLHKHWYASMIDQVSGSNLTDPKTSSLIYTYGTVTHGFAAKLTSMEAAALKNLDGCLDVIPDSINQLHTTRTPDFLGFSSSYGLWPESDFGNDVIVGLLDTGIWPESKSFSDEGLNQVPARWKGECEVGTQFNVSHCNRKLIGARYFVKGFEAYIGGPIDQTVDILSPRDNNGHGSHTSSTAAGSEVSQASLFGFASGTARGIATKARLAVYKVCWSPGCFDSDILAGMEAAVSDGVDLISISLGAGGVVPYYSDPIAIGSLATIQKGVFVSCSAGNGGPNSFTVVNTAPWITTVGAGTIDRDFPAPVVLGNGEIYKGSSLYKGRTMSEFDQLMPLVYGKTASSINDTANLCLDGSLDPEMVRGKIVVCDIGGIFAEKAVAVQQAGGAGMILANRPIDGQQMWTVAYLSPATNIGSKATEDVKAYINSTRNPTASIRAEGLTEVGKAVRAPAVAGFSSRGPNPIVPEIMKPDLFAPGVSILAAWTGDNGPTELISDKRRVDYNIISGTSMACPHVTGIAALIRGVHPTWTPAAIRSALMTSSILFDSTGSPIRDLADRGLGGPANAFAIGAGHVNPSAALDPGLVYDLGIEDYFRFICTLNYNETQNFILTKKADFSCPSSTQQHGDLNYPSFSVVFRPRNLVRVTARTVTNVGGGPSLYEIAVESPPSVNVIVEPSRLSFESQNEKANFTVRFESKIAGDQNKTSGLQEFGQISWKCVKGGRQVVRSPLAIEWHYEDKGVTNGVSLRRYTVICYLFFFLINCLLSMDHFIYV